MLVNTSFNVRGEPIVCTPEDAYRCFLATEWMPWCWRMFLLSRTGRCEAGLEHVRLTSRSSTRLISTVDLEKRAGDDRSLRNSRGHPCVGRTFNSIATYDFATVRLSLAGVLHRNRSLGDLGEREHIVGLAFVACPDRRFAGTGWPDGPSRLCELDGTGIPNRLDCLAIHAGADVLWDFHTIGLVFRLLGRDPLQRTRQAGIILGTKTYTNRLKRYFKHFKHTRHLIRVLNWSRAMSDISPKPHRFREGSERSTE